MTRAAVVVFAACALAAADVSVTSGDGLTTLTISAATGDLEAASSPGKAPLLLAAGSGSFLGYAAAPTGSRAGVYPSVVVAPCNASLPAQQFALAADGRVLAAGGALCLDVWDCGTANGTVVDLYPCDASGTCGDPVRTLNELFTLDAATGELWSLLGPPRSLCVEVAAGGGGVVDLWSCSGDSRQAWRYDAVSGLLSSVGVAGMCLSAPAGPPPPPPPCAWAGAAAVSGGGGAAVVVARNASCLGGAATVLVTDVYASAATSIVWTTAYDVTAASGAALPAFTLPFGSSLRAAAGGAPLALWTTWTRGCVDNGADATPGMCFGAGAWREPFSPLPLPVAPPSLLRLGNRDWGAVFAAFGGAIDDSITVPLVSLLRDADDFGLTLLLSPEEPLLETLLRADGARIDFARLLRRLAVGAPAVTTTAHVRAHAADWRPALALLLDAHPALVLPHAANAADFDGLGGYSWQAPVNATYAASVGFRTNWELSGTFMPFDGLFAPYADEWLNLGPINAGLPQYAVNYSSIAAFDAAVQAAGLNSLSYFDIGNWGVSIDTSRAWPNLTCGLRPSGGPAPCPTPAGANAFLQHYLSDALLDEGWSVAGGFFSGAKSDWVGTTLMDPSEPFFEDLLMEQLGRRMGALVPSAQGVGLDRFDYTAYYSLKRDDGLSWVPQPDGRWGPAQSLLSSHLHAYARMAAVLRAAPGPAAKLALGNCNTLCRIDLAASFDGGFSEGAALNAVAFLGLRRPSILWTYSLAGHDDAALDAYFQQHALMRVFPMAPMPGNDHSITPGDARVQAAYVAYAPLFTALRGLQWVLDAPRPVSVAAAGAPAARPLANLFRVSGTSDAPPAAPGELLAVVVFAGPAAAAAAVSVTGASLFAAGVAAVDAFALGPSAAAAWLPLGRLPVVNATVVAPALPLLRGCALLRLVPVSA